MSRYTGPRHKIARRLGISLDGTGKDIKRNYPPGQHGPSRRGKMSEFGIQLQEKQKLRHMYGLNEKQFRRTFNEASKAKGVVGENFMILLESRLDNLVYRLGFARTRPAARTARQSRSRYRKRKKSGHPFLQSEGRRCDRIA